MIVNKAQPSWLLLVEYMGEYIVWLLNIIGKQITTHKAFVYFKILQHNAKAGLRPLWRTRKKSHLMRSVIYTKRSNLIGCYAPQRIVIGPRKSRLCQTWLKHRSSWNENLQRKQNWTTKSTNNVKKMLENSSQFLSSEQLCEPKSLDVASKIAGVEKIPSESLWLWST